MAAKEMYDYLSDATPDYSSATLTVAPQDTITERGKKNQVVHFGLDGSEERISLADESIFWLTYIFHSKSAADVGTVLDYFHDAAKGNGITRTFYLAHATDGHVYVVRFANLELPRTIRAASVHGIGAAEFKVIGRKPDA